MRIISVLLLFFTFALDAVECPFCDSKNLERQQLFQGCYWRILLDYQPALPGHLLLVPIAHRLTRHELTLEEHEELYVIENIVHEALKNRFGTSIENLQYEKNGPTLQSVNHFHIHVLPIAKEQGSLLGRWRLIWSLFAPRTKLSESELKAEKKLFIEQFLPEGIPPAEAKEPLPLCDCPSLTGT